LLVAAGSEVTADFSGTEKGRSDDLVLTLTDRALNDRADGGSSGDRLRARAAAASPSAQSIDLEKNTTKGVIYEKAMQ
jgi:hypothetical protein